MMSRHMTAQEWTILLTQLFDGLEVTCIIPVDNLVTTLVSLIMSSQEVQK